MILSKPKINDSEYRKGINYEEVSELKRYPPCPYYERPVNSLNAICRATGQGQWISASEDTKFYCHFFYTECLRYMEAKGIEDDEYIKLNEEYFKELFGKDYIPLDQLNQRPLIKLKGGKKNGRTTRKLRAITRIRIHPVRRPRKVCRREERDFKKKSNP